MISTELATRWKRRISAVAGCTAEFGAEGVGLATRRPALLHKSQPIICVASSLLLAEAIRASSGWKILLIGVLSQFQMIKGTSHWLCPANVPK